MTNEEFVKIIIKEVYLKQKKSIEDLFYEIDIKKTVGDSLEVKKIFDSCSESEKRLLIDYISTISDNTVSMMLSIIDEWGGGYYNDGNKNDGHFELYYVSDEKNKYKYRVDEDSCDMFIEQMEIIK